MSRPVLTPRNAGALGVGSAVALLVALLALLGALAPLERTLIDLRYKHARLQPEPMSDDIRFVDIDDKTLDEYGRWSSWSRSRLAMVVDELARAGARVIALDLLFSDREEPTLDPHTGEPIDPDALLAASVRRAGNVVLGIDVARGDRGPIPQRQAERWRALAGDGEVRLAPTGASASLPYPDLARAAASFGVVSVTRDMDPDDAVRRLGSKYESPVGPVPPFALAAAQLFAGGPSGLADREVIHIDWPTSPNGWIGALRQSERDPPTHGHVSLGVVYDLALQRRKLDRIEREWDRLTGALAAALDYEGVTGEAIADVRDEARFQAESAEGVDLATLPAEDRDRLRPWLEWWEVDRARREGRGSIERASRELESELSGKLVLVGWTATGQTEADVVRTPLGPNTPGVFVHGAVASMALTGRWRAHLSGLEIPFTIILGFVVAFVATRLSALGATAVTAGIALAFVGVAGVWAFGEWRIVLPLAAPLLGLVGAWASTITYQAWLSQRERLRITRQFKARVSPALVDKLIANPDAVSVEGEQREMTIFFLDLAGFTAVSERLDGPTTVRLLNRVMRDMTRVLTEHGAYVNKFLGDGLMAFWSAFEPDDRQAARACRAALECVRAVELINAEGALPDGSPIGARIGITTGRVVVGDCGAPPELNDYTVIGDAVNLAARLESANKQFGSTVLIDGATRSQLDDPSIRTRPLGRIVVVGQSTPVEVHELVTRDGGAEQEESARAALGAFASGDLDRAEALWRDHAARFPDDRLGVLYIEEIEARRASPSEASVGVLRLRVK